MSIRYMLPTKRTPSRRKKVTYRNPETFDAGDTRTAVDWWAEGIWNELSKQTGIGKHQFATDPRIKKAVELCSKHACSLCYPESMCNKHKIEQSKIIAEIMARLDLEHNNEKGMVNIEDVNEVMDRFEAFLNAMPHDANYMPQYAKGTFLSEFEEVRNKLNALSKGDSQ